MHHKLSRLLRAIQILAFAGVLAIDFSAGAWPWQIEPQPALHQRDALWSDADSPLAWDSSWRVLWHLSGGKLTGAFWSGRTLVPASVEALAPRSDAGLLVDSSLHFLYCADANGIPYCVRRSAGAWIAEKMAEAPIGRLLAVDGRRRSVFAYDAAARGIRLFTYEAKSKAWVSALIATGLGAAEEAGAFDPTSRILYTTHESADTALPRHPSARSIPDLSGIGAWKAWPLVATAWNGTEWTSRVLAETGVPQQPAVRLTDHRLFYAQRDEPDLVHFYQPAVGRWAETFGSEAGWSGVDTWVDHHYYTIRRPDYPGAWNSAGLSVQTGWNFWHLNPEVTLQGPITVVPYYEPLWTDTTLPPRLLRFRATINPRQSRLVQHRLRAAGEIVREQTGQRLAGYLYRDTNGVLAQQGRSASRFFGLREAVQLYPKLDATFDPTNPPPHFSDLASAAARFFAYKQDTTLLTRADEYTTSISQQIPPTFSTDPESPWVAAHLRLPTSVQSRTFGHNYRSKALDQVGGRHRTFLSASTSLASPSQLAVDPSTGATFYTQATQPPTDLVTGGPSLLGPFLEYTPIPLAGFSREPERKFAVRPQSVWIVFVY